MSRGPFDPCSLAVERYKNFAKWRNLWTILLFVFGSTVVFFLCACIVLFINASWLPGAITTLSTIVNGLAIGWVLARRREALEEESQAYEDLKTICGAEGGGAPGISRAPIAPTGPNDGVPQDVLDYQKKLRLLGSIR